MRGQWIAVVVVWGIIGISGCTDAAAPVATEQHLKSTSEVMTDAEMQQFLRLISRLPDRQVPEFTPFEQPQLDTLLPAKVLIAEFRSRYRELCDPQRQGNVWDANLNLSKPAQVEGWTSAQLASFIRCLSCAVVKERLAKKHDLKQIEQHCRQQISGIVAVLDREDQRPRSQMTEAFVQQREGRVQQLARMVAMLEFITQLKSVPAANIELVQKYAGQIQPLLPQASTQDPFVEPFANNEREPNSFVPTRYQAN